MASWVKGLRVYAAKVPLLPWLRRLPLLQQMINQHTPASRKNNPTNGLANEKLTLIFTPNERSLWHRKSAKLK